MSQIKLLHSGGNGVIIAAPDNNPTSDRTLKIPSDGDGTILTTNSSVGKILQVVSTTYNTKASVSISNNYANNSSYIYYISGLDTTITTTAANSKIIISGSVFGENSESDHVTGFVLSSSIGGTVAPIDALRGVSDGNRGRLTSMMNTQYWKTNQDSTASTTSFTNFEYSPSQSSGTAIIIKVGVVLLSGSTSTFYVNRTVADDNTINNELGVSNITLMEVAA